MTPARKNLSIPITVICLLTIGDLGSPVQAEEHPNIVIVLADDMGMGDTSAYQDWSGNSDAVQLHTPALDRLARAGVRFTDAHAPHSRCTTTRYSLLTGRYCWRTRLKHWVLFGVHGAPLIERDRITLPEFLQNAGYQTGMVGKWHVGLTYRRSDNTASNGWNDADLTKPLADGPLDHGFHFFHGVSRSHGTSGPNGAKRNQPSQSIGPGWIHNRTVTGATKKGKQLDGSYRLNEVGDVLDREAFSFLDSTVASEKPFLLYFASPANHAPYTPSKQIGDSPVEGASQFVDGSLTSNNRLDFIYQNDVHVARLIEYLGKEDDPRRPNHKLLENTLFIFTSDNGAERPSKVFTGPLRSNKGSVYEGGHRIPFIASWPLGGIGDGNPATPGETRTGLLGLNDIYATIADILDRPLPKVDGRARGAEDSVSRLEAMRTGHSKKRPALFTNDHKEASRKLSDSRAWVAVRSNAAPIPGQWKLLLDQRFAFDSKIVPQELYNLASDPLETENLVDAPSAQPALKFLIDQAARAAGDAGHSRP